MWTMDELVERVGRALAAEYPGAPNGRIRDVPDRRAIRWYTTTGLVDRPAEMRGRTALYGPRHLLQLVAVKRRQAEGRSIAEIQVELAGAPDQTLREIAAVPEALLTGDGDEAARVPAGSGPREVRPAGPPPFVDSEGAGGQAPMARPRFWAARSAGAQPAE